MGVKIALCQIDVSDDFDEFMVILSQTGQNERWDHKGVIIW